MKHFLALKPFILQHKHRYLLGIMWLLILDIIQLVTPKVLGAFTDQLATGQMTAKKMLLFAGIILLIAIFTFIFRFLWRWYVFGVARTFEYTFKSKLFAHLQRLSPNWYNHNKVGDMMAHATNDIGAVRFSLGGGVIMFFDTVILVSLILVMMLTTINVSLTLLALIPLPLLALTTNRFGKTIHQRFRKSQEAFSNVTTKVQENFSGMRVVKAFVQEEAEIEKFKEANQDYMQKNLNLIKVQAIFHPLISLFAGFSLLIVLGYGGYLVLNQVISLGDFVAFSSYLSMLTWPMMAIGQMINIFQRGSASMARLNVIFNTKPEIEDDERTDHSIQTIQGDIRIDNLSFRYPNTERYVLKNINIHVPTGKTLAIVGRTGSGKTTLVNLITRLYNIEEGSITIDGHPLHTIPLDVLRSNIGYVPQDNFLFSTTIRENIAFGLDQYSEEDIIQAARDAQVLDNILDFPDQFDTLLGERGVTLSGGQKQRISIARALIKNPHILILDDSLSAVDTKTEENILKRLKEIMRERTSIIIAHRISTIKDADEIIVLDDGEIVERGNHEYLLSLNGIYAEMYQKQLLEQMIESA